MSRLRMGNGLTAEPNEYGPLPNVNGGDAGAVGGTVVTDDKYEYALPVNSLEYAIKVLQINGQIANMHSLFFC